MNTEKENQFMVYKLLEYAYWLHDPCTHILCNFSF